MLVTLLGMVTDVREVQPEKALSPMLVTLFGIWVFLQANSKQSDSVKIIALQLSLESYLGLSDATLMEVRPVQP